MIEPKIQWLPDLHGVWIAQMVGSKRGRPPKNPCTCIGLYGSPRRKIGAHHVEGCPKWKLPKPLSGENLGGKKMTEFASESESSEPRKTEEELPEVVWAPVRGGIWVQRFVRDSAPDRPHRKRPPCECTINTSARRRPGTHHDEGCPRRRSW